MLHVIKVNENLIPEILETDEYIPVKIRWKDPNCWDKEIIYWRTGDLKKSLLEVAINTLTCHIDRVTVVGFDKVFFLDKSKNSIVNDIVYGIPVIELKQKPDYNSIDDKGMFEVHLSKDKVDLVMSHNEIVKRIISGRVFFDVDKNSDICVISVSQLTQAEHDLMKDTLKYMDNPNI